MKTTKENLLKQLDALKIFPNNKLVKQLRRQIQDKINKHERQIKVKPTKQEITKKANQNRSGKLRRYHNYIRQIRNNFPNLEYHEIRKQLSRRKKGKDVSIPDVIWQNPSP